jgi:putative membrane protein
MTGGTGLLAHIAVRGAATVDPGVLAALGLAGLGYAGAVAIRWRRHHRLPVRRRHVAGFTAGLAVLAVALASPLDALAAQRFAPHMVQHLLLMLVAAPLVVSGRPSTVILAAVPPGRRRVLHRATSTRGWRAVAAVLAHPIVVWALGTAVLWAWHLPALYELALRNDAVHAAEHATFLGTAALFWGLVIGAGRRRSPIGRPVALALTFATALASSALGAALTFAAAPLYPLQAARAAAAGVSPLEDQQLAGVLMWVPPGFIYLVTMATLLVRWFAELDTGGDGEAPARTLLAEPVR